MDYPNFEAIKLERKGPIMVLTLNRPEHRNAMLMHQGHRELEDFWPLVSQDEDVKVIVITGAGDAFSAGGDVKAMAERAGTVEGLKYTLRVPSQTKRMWQNLLDVPQPIIAAVNGDAVGLGATLALFCDVVFMSETARFGDTHVKVGLVAGDGGSIMWPLLMGPAKAKELLMRARLLTGKEAAELNLVNHAVPQEEVMPRSMELAEELAKSAQWAIRWTKLSVNQWLKHQVNLMLDGSIAFEMLSMNTHDHFEAARAFAEKRKPDFKGY